jgi:hypothetical protein
MKDDITSTLYLITGTSARCTFFDRVPKLHLCSFGARSEAALVQLRNGNLVPRFQPKVEQSGTVGSSSIVTRAAHQAMDITYPHGKKT